MKAIPPTTFLLALAACALAACAPPATVNQQSEEAAIRAIGQEWQRAVVARDVDKIVSFFAPDVVIMTPNAPVTRGLPAARALWTAEVNTPGLAVSWAPTQIEITSATTAAEIGTYNVALDGPNGRINDTGSYVSHWRKINGQWRMTSDALVSSKPMDVGDPLASLGMDTTGMEMRQNTSLTWTDMVVPGFPPGARRAIVHGNPAGTGDYVLRIQLPDGFQVPVHWHPKGEHLTVLSGTFNLGMGGDRNASTRAYAAGDFAFLPPRSAHFARASGPTTIQLHGIGPFQQILGTP